LSGVISVVEYEPAWPQRFEQLRHEYAEAMAAAGVPVVAIEHVGSTSVPGLAAKPFIDCDIVVAGQDVAAASQVLTGLGFRPLGELGIPLRWAFKEPERLAGTSTYVVVEGSLSLRNHLAVRNILRADADLREQYAAVKRRVGATAASIDEYGRGEERDGSADPGRRRTVRRRASVHRRQSGAVARGVSQVAADSSDYPICRGQGSIRAYRGLSLTG
jgi:GrpB-like predicted nucleotidyltransferase (UPF0157 family)